MPSLSEAFLKPQSYNEHIFRKFYLDYHRSVLGVTSICGREIYVVFPAVWIALSCLCPCNPLQICKTHGPAGRIACWQHNRIFHSIKQAVSYRDKTFNLGFISLGLPSINLEQWWAIAPHKSNVSKSLPVWGPMTKNGCYSFTWLKKNKNKINKSVTWKFHKIHAPSFTYWLGLLLCFSGRDWPPKPKIKMRVCVLCVCLCVCVYCVLCVCVRISHSYLA